jgi:flagellar hook protein FlgE
MSFYTSLSGLKGAQTDLGTVSNNIANVGTVGFKKSRAQFGDIVAASATTAGQGTRLKKIEQQFSQGGFESSSKELDLAIAGNGFFVTRDGLTGGTTNFTRNGSFTVDSERYLSIPPAATSRSCRSIRKATSPPPAFPRRATCSCR